MPKNDARTVVVTVIRMVLLIAGFALVLSEQPRLLAQEPPVKSEAPSESDLLKKLIDRIQKNRADIDRFNHVAPAMEGNSPPQVFAMLDLAHIGSFYAGNGQTRFLALRVLMANTTDQDFTVMREQVITEIDGESRSLKDLPKILLNYSIPSARRQIQISTIKRPKEWKLNAGGQAELWLLYAELPPGSSVPKCRVKIKLGEMTKEIDVNNVQAAQLGLNVERIGPRQSLALFTIGGTLTTFNTGTLVEELDKLVEQKVARVVIRWGEGATPPDNQLNLWLQNAAAGNSGNPNQSPVFPIIPIAIREFHLTEFPTTDDVQVRNNYAYGLRPTPQIRVHKTALESVGAALRTAYLALPQDELLNEIKSGHPLSRAAGLAIGGSRLSVDQLPQIFEWADDKDPEIQKAALQSLSHFGEPQVIDKLILFAQRNVEPLSSSAIESLAGSRFGTAHDALLNLLKNEPASSRKRIVQVLAKYPRPIWSEALFDFVTNPSTDMDLDSLNALVLVGHPRLVDVLESGLNSTEKSIRDLSFQELSKRSDELSDSLAIEYSLKLLETAPPDANVLQLLSRTKEPRAIPLLFKQLETSSDRVSTINLLLQIGDQNVADRLAQKYPVLNTDEKVQVLQGMKVFRHSRFRAMCGEAILSSDNKLVTTAANSLTQDGHPEGEKLLIAALETQKNSHLFRNILNALAGFGTPSAREALIKIRESVEAKKKDDVTQALTILNQRSPGFQYVQQARNHRFNNQDKEALEAYDVAVQLDPSLPEAYLERGMVSLKLYKYGAARKDFEKVLELKHEPRDPEFADFITSLAITRVIDGELAEGLKFLESHREAVIRRTQDKGSKGLFHYNVACAYARAVEQTDKQTELADRDILREKYRKQAIDDLTEAFNHGFRDYDYTANDPDFVILHEDADFKKILSNKPNDKPDDKPKPDDE